MGWDIKVIHVHIKNDALSALIFFPLIFDGEYLMITFFKTTDFFNSFLVSSEFYPLLITFRNSLDPDQDPHNVGPDLHPSSSTHSVSEIIF